jgi:hypothetical protein
MIDRWLPLLPLHPTTDEERPSHTFQEPDDADHDAIDHTYRTQYARYASSYVEPMVSPEATAATLRLVPR